MGASASSLELRVEVRAADGGAPLPEPVTVSASRTTTLEIMVRATNPEFYSVAVPVGGPPVQVGSSAAQSSGISFGLRVDGDPAPAAAFAAVWSGDGRDPVLFAPRQTIVATFEQRVGTRGRTALRPGEYRLIPSFAQREGEPVRLVVEP